MCLLLLYHFILLSFALLLQWLKASLHSFVSVLPVPMVALPAAPLGVSLWARSWEIRLLRPMSNAEEGWNTGYAGKKLWRHYSTIKTQSLCSQTSCNFSKVKILNNIEVFCIHQSWIWLNELILTRSEKTKWHKNCQMRLVALLQSFIN